MIKREGQFLISIEFMQIFSYFKKTHSTPDIELIWEHEWGGKAIFSHGTSAARGIAMFMSKEIYVSISNVYTDEEGRMIVVDITQQDKIITIAGIYAPNIDNPSFYIDLSQKLKDRQEHKVVIGDFNLALNIELDRENTFCNNNRAKEEVENLMEQYSLVDVWRRQNGDRREFSWRKKSQWPVKASRIDFALISAGIDQQVETIQYLSSICTDHRAVYMVVDLQPFMRGTGYWKFNNLLLNNQRYVEMMNREISLTISTMKDKEPLGTWEKIKKRIKEVTIEFSRSNVSEEKMVIAQLSEKVNEYETRLPLNKDENKIMEETKAELEDKHLQRIKGVMFRSKAKWYEEGERNSKYFFSLEKS